MDLQFQFKSQCSYLFKKHLGGGASAEVFLYSRETKGLPTQDVVLKILKTNNESAVRELINDGEALSRLKHPNILSTFGYEKINSSKFGLLLEYFPGTSLAQLIPKIESHQRHDIACFLVPTIIQALAAAHGRGITHGDISGRNILVSEQGQIKLADFGLATLKSETAKTGELKGSIDYFAPERWDGMPSSEYSDVFSVGILTLEVLTGKNGLHSIRPRDGKHRLLEFLDKKTWNRFPLWKNFFDKTLKVDPHQRLLANQLLEMVPSTLSNLLECQNIIGQCLRHENKETFPYLKTLCFKSKRIGVLGRYLPIDKTIYKTLSYLLVVGILFIYGIPVPWEVSSVGNVRPLLLTLTSRPWGSVFIDNQFKGYTPLVRLPLPAGYHEIVWKGPSGQQIKRSLQAYKFNHIHYKIFLEKKGPLANKRPVVVY